MFKADLQEARRMKTYEECFQFYTNTTTFKEILPQFVEHFTKMQKVFNQIFQTYSKVLLFYNFDENAGKSSQQQPPTVPKMSDRVLTYYSVQNYQLCKERREAMIGTTFFANLDFYICCLFDNTYQTKCTIDLLMPYSDKIVQDICVSSQEILHWNTLMTSFIDTNGTYKAGAHVFYKFLLNDAQLCYCYDQICVWIVKYVENIFADALKQ